MSDRRLYTLLIAEEALSATPGTSRQDVQTLSGAATAATPTGQNPGEIRLRGQFGDDYAELLGTELRELLSATAYNYLPYYFVANAGTNDTHPDAGYYPSEETRHERVVPKTSGIAEFDVGLVREGTRESHRRRVRTDTTQRAHVFGTATEALVAAPAAAEHVRWVSTDRDSAAAAAVSTTLTTEFGDVDQYRIDLAPTGDNSQLVYDLPYDEAGNVDARVFDTWGNSETDSEGRFAWQQVYTTDHEYRGDVILENGLLRLMIDTTNFPNSLTVEEYTGGSWSSLGLGTSDWRLAEIDIRRIAPPDVRAMMRFEDTSSSDEHTLEAVLHRGWDAVQFLEPADSEQNLLQASQAPSGLGDRLDPIAATTIIDPEARQGLIARENIPL